MEAKWQGVDFHESLLPRLLLRQSQVQQERRLIEKGMKKVRISPIEEVVGVDEVKQRDESQEQ